MRRMRHEGGMQEYPLSLCPPTGTRSWILGKDKRVDRSVAGCEKTCAAMMEDVEGRNWDEARRSSRSQGLKRTPGTHGDGQERAAAAGEQET